MIKGKKEIHALGFVDGRPVYLAGSALERLTPGKMPGQYRGVFETLPAQRGRIFLLDEHLRRLRKGLKALKVGCPYSHKRFGSEIIRALESAPLKTARVRLMVWQKRKGGRVHAAVTLAPYRGYPAAKYRRGFKAAVSGTRNDRAAHGEAVKSIRYRRFLRAYEKAAREGYDEAILLNRTGQVTEGSRSNIFFFKGGVLFTPSLQCGCLDGIIRRLVLRFARGIGIKCRTLSCGLKDLFEAEEVFLTNSMAGVMPVTVIDGHKIGRGRPGPLTGRLMDKYKLSLYHLPGL